MLGFAISCLCTVQILGYLFIFGFVEEIDAHVMSHDP